MKCGCEEALKAPIRRGRLVGEPAILSFCALLWLPLAILVLDKVLPARKLHFPLTLVDGAGQIGSELRVLEDEADKVAAYLDKAIQAYRPAEIVPRKVMDFGCGQGYLVKALGARGYDVLGCDVQRYWNGKGLPHESRLHAIAMQPYRLPFEDNTFDVAVSTSVMEHVKNKEEVFAEIHRVLKPGGYAIHQFPGKWYLPTEPHMKVPLVNQLWPFCPRWWFYLWARLGIRSDEQVDQSWRQVAEQNHAFYTHHLSYWTNSRYKRLSMQVFKNYSAPMTFYLQHSYGGFAKIFRQLPLKRFSGWLSSQCRVNFIVLRKLP